MAEQSPAHGLLIEGVRLPLCCKQQQQQFSSVSAQTCSRTTCSERTAMHGESAGGTLQTTVNDRIPADSLLPTRTTIHSSGEH